MQYKTLQRQIRLKNLSKAQKPCTIILSRVPPFFRLAKRKNKVNGNTKINKSYQVELQTYFPHLPSNAKF